MYGYIVRRILLMIPTLIGVALITFVLMRLVPGDIVLLRLQGEGGGNVTAEMIQAERQRLGLNDSLAVQFGEWMLGILKGDLGTSMWTGRPVIEELNNRFQLSLEVAILSTLLATSLAIPLGTLAALRQDRWPDYFVRVFSIAGIATPSFWLGILMILAFLIVFKWMPPIKYTPLWVDPAANLSQLIWPALATGYRYSAVATRMTRSAVLEVFREDYIRTARAKGLMEHVIINRHALKNAMLPVITVIGLEFAFLIGGLVVTEQVFNLNGLGLLFVKAIGTNDYILVQALVLVSAVTFVFTNFAVDLLYAWLDPRIHYH